jgi:hypothetical protein
MLTFEEVKRIAKTILQREPTPKELERIGDVLLNVYVAGRIEGRAMGMDEVYFNRMY